MKKCILNQSILTDDEEFTEQPSSVRQCSRLLLAGVLGLIINTSVFSEFSSKSQKVITERCGCLQSAVSKHIKCKVDWKEEFG